MVKYFSKSLLLCYFLPVNELEKGNVVCFLTYYIWKSMSPCTISYVPSDSEPVLPRAEFPGLDFPLPSVKFFLDQFLKSFFVLFLLFLFFFML